MTLQKQCLRTRSSLLSWRRAVPPSRESGMSVARPALRSCSHFQTPSRCSMMMMHLSCSRRLFLVPLPSCRSRSPPSDPSWQLAPQDNTPPATRVGTGINSGGCWQGVGDHCNNRARADPNFTHIVAERYQHGQVLVLR